MLVLRHEVVDDAAARTLGVDDPVEAESGELGPGRIEALEVARAVDHERELEALAGRDLGLVDLRARGELPDGAAESVRAPFRRQLRDLQRELASAHHRLAAVRGDAAAHEVLVEPRRVREPEDRSLERAGARPRRDHRLRDPDHGEGPPCDDAIRDAQGLDARPIDHERQAPRRLGLGRVGERVHSGRCVGERRGVDLHRDVELLARGLDGVVTEEDRIEADPDLDDEGLVHEGRRPIGDDLDEGGSGGVLWRSAVRLLKRGAPA